MVYGTWEGLIDQSLFGACSNYFFIIVSGKYFFSTKYMKPKWQIECIRNKKLPQVQERVEPFSKERLQELQKQIYLCCRFYSKVVPDMSSKCIDS